MTSAPTGLLALGVGLIALGLLLVPLPGPGWLVVSLGVPVLVLGAILALSQRLGARGR